MDEFICLEERAERFSQILAKSTVTEDHGLVKLMPLMPEHLRRIQGAVARFIGVCLYSFYPGEHFLIDRDVLDRYPEQILGLPNITPNGLVLPTNENQFCYNDIHREVGAGFAEIGLGEYIDKIQFPINIRLQSGAPDPEIDSRPRASVKPHTDIWAGDPASGLMVFLSVFGSPERSGIRFFKNERFPKSFVRTLSDYNEGREITDQGAHICDFKTNFWFLVDPYVIHQTTKQGPGLRLSLDFRFTSKRPVKSDGDVAEVRRRFFIGFEEWMSVGHSKLMMTSNPLVRKNLTSDKYTRGGYPVEIGISDLDVQLF